MNIQPLALATRGLSASASEDKVAGEWAIVNRDLSHATRSLPAGTEVVLLRCMNAGFRGKEWSIEVHGNDVVSTVHGISEEALDLVLDA